MCIRDSTTNLAFLAALTRHPDVRSGKVDTGLIARDLGPLTARPPLPPEATALAALAALDLLTPPTGIDPWDALTGWRGWSCAESFVTLDHRGTTHALKVGHLGQRRFRVTDGGDTTALALLDTCDSNLRFETDGLIRSAGLARTADTITIFLDGQSFGFHPVLPQGETGHAHSGDTINAPMPGLVAKLPARPGATVRKGDPLIVLEAMKMEHVLTAPRDGRIAEVLVAEGDQVADGTTLVRLEGEDA